MNTMPGKVYIRKSRKVCRLTTEVPLSTKARLEALSLCMEATQKVVMSRAIKDLFESLRGKPGLPLDAEYEKRLKLLEDLPSRHLPGAFSHDD